VIAQSIQQNIALSGTNVIGTNDSSYLPLTNILVSLVIKITGQWWKKAASA
jgi:hypothetical protein